MFLKKIWMLLIFSLLLVPALVFAYHIRMVNLGATNFIDGLPLPAGPGFYLREYLSYFKNDDKRLNSSSGELLTSANFESLALNNQLIYQSDVSVLGGDLGGDIILPVVLHLKIDPNPLNFSSSGAGVDDLLAGIFIQWPISMRNGEPFFASRLELDAYFPTGDYEVEHGINPGTNTYSVEPYWAATLFLEPRLTVSCRIHFLFTTEDPATGIRPGDVFHVNFASSYAVVPKKLRLGVAGYYLRQYEDSTEYGVTMVSSKERVLAFGPGFVYHFTKASTLFANVYFETEAENRAIGNRYTLSFATKL